MSKDEQRATRKKIAESEAWRRRKAEVVRAIQDLDVHRSALVGLLRSIESEEKKVREGK